MARGGRIVWSVALLSASACEAALGLNRYNLCSDSCDAAATDDAAPARDVGVVDAPPTDSGAAGPDAAIYRINSGGQTVGAFVGDIFDMGGQPFATTHAIDTSAVEFPAAPMGVYQDYYYGAHNSAFSYTLPELTPGARYWLRLHFADIYDDASGQRLFDVSANGQPLLTAFDVIKEASGPYRALVKEFETTADDAGLVTIVFTSRPPPSDVAMVSGVELLTSP
jgi:hypothetical protein